MSASGCALRNVLAHFLAAISHFIHARRTSRGPIALCANETESVEAELKNIKKPQQKLEMQKKSVKRDINSTTRSVSVAAKNLKEMQDALLAKQGSSESVKAKNIEKQNVLKDEVAQGKEKGEEYQKKLNEVWEQYEAGKEELDDAHREMSDTEKQIKDLEKYVKELKNTGGSTAVFGQKAPQMVHKIEEAKRRGKFRGTVLGPVGNYIQVKSGKEKWAKLADVAIGNIALQTFICDDNRDLALMRRLRKDCGCREMEIPITCQQPGARYNAPSQIDGVSGLELCMNVLTIEHDIVFNFLCDSCRVERKALAPSKEESEKKLIAKHNGRMVVIDANVQECYFYPQGDYWILKNGNLSIRSNESKLQSRLGRDTASTIEDTNKEMDSTKKVLKAQRLEAKR